jgi:hypothetical protein
MRCSTDSSRAMRDRLQRVDPASVGRRLSIRRMVSSSGDRSSRGWLWSVIVLTVALPALASPLILVPVPEGVRVPVGFIRGFVGVCGIPRFWATATTVVALLGVRRYSASWLLDLLVCAIVITSWWCASDTTGRMRVF